MLATLQQIVQQPALRISLGSGLLIASTRAISSRGAASRPTSTKHEQRFYPRQGGSLVRKLSVPSHRVEEQAAPVVEASITFLKSKAALLESVIKKNPEDYFEPDSFVLGSIGSHMRHSLAHFEKVIKAAQCDEEEAGRTVHYDIRQGIAGCATEIDPLAAEIRITELIASLERIGSGDLSAPLPVSFILDGAEVGEYTFQSNIERELWFCVHHGIHHAALMRLVMKRLGGYENAVNLDKSFGTAPATQKFEEKFNNLSAFKANDSA